MSRTAELIAGLTPTGRRITGPAFDLVEGTADNGLKHLALVYRPQYADHPALGADLQRVVGFMENPDVPGVARLSAWEPEAGTLVYPTGTVWPVLEVVRTFAEIGAGAGVKAGLELCYLVAEMLTEAHKAASAQGLRSHGSLSPWNIVLKGDGQPRVLGYGLPQVDLLAAASGGPDPTEDTYRYAPPERVEGHDEDLSSDLFALALISLEVMMGRPVYDGLVDDIRQQATRGEGMRRLYQWRERIPNNVREVLGRALKPDPDTRYRSGADFVYELHDLMGSLDVEGPSLVEVMAKVRAMQKRGKAAQPGDSGALSTAEIREIAADLDVFDESALPAPRIEREQPDSGDEERPRWAPSSRGGADEEQTDERSLSARERLKRRLRTGGASGGTTSGDTASGGSDSARDRLKQRLKKGRSSSSGGRSNPSTEDRAAARDRLRRRLRRSSGGAPAAADDLSTGELPVLDLDPDSARLDPDAVAAADTDTDPAEPLVTTPEPSIEVDVAATEVVDESPAAALRKSAAAELLAKLRTSGGRRRRRSGDTPVSTTSRRTPVSAPEADVPTAPTPPEPSEPALPDPTPTPTPAPTSRPQTSSPATARPLETPEPDARVEVRLVDPPATVSAPAGTTAAGLVRMATVDRGRVPVDLGGRVTGWWRLAVGTELLPGDASIDGLEGPLSLVWVPNATRVLTFEVRGEGDPVRFQSPVGIAVPAGWLLQHLCAWLDLPEAPWQLRVADRVLGPDRILAEVLAPGDVVVVERG